MVKEPFQSALTAAIQSSNLMSNLMERVQQVEFLWRIQSDVKCMAEDRDGHTKDSTQLYTSPINGGENPSFFHFIPVVPPSLLFCAGNLERSK